MDDVFTVDHAKQLSDMVMNINRNWLHELHRVMGDNDIPLGHTSYEVDKVLYGWQNDIEMACKAKMCGMQAMMEQFQKLATDAVSVRVPTFEIWPEGSDPIRLRAREGACEHPFRYKYETETQWKCTICGQPCDAPEPYKIQRGLVGGI